MFRDLELLVMGLVLLGAAFCAFMLFGSMVESTRHGPGKCFKGEIRRVHQSAWIQYVHTGNTVIPIFHGAQDYDKWFCLIHQEYKRLPPKRSR
jgi:hypothetical protein